MEAELTSWYPYWHVLALNVCVAIYVVVYVYQILIFAWEFESIFLGETYLGL